MDALRMLRAERQRQGLTQIDVATRMGVSMSVFQRLEYGQRDVRASTLERYAIALGMRLKVSLVPQEDDGPE